MSVEVAKLVIASGASRHILDEYPLAANLTRTTALASRCARNRRLVQIFGVGIDSSLPDDQGITVVFRLQRETRHRWPPPFGEQGRVKIAQRSGRGSGPDGCTLKIFLSRPKETQSAARARLRTFLICGSRVHRGLCRVARRCACRGRSRPGH